MGGNVFVEDLPAEGTMPAIAGFVFASLRTHERAVSGPDVEGLAQRVLEAHVGGERSRTVADESEQAPRLTACEPHRGWASTLPGPGRDMK